MYGYQLGAVGEGGFDLHFVHHLGHAFHHVVVAEQGGAVLHQLGHAHAVAGGFLKVAGNIGDGFGVVELEAAGAAFGGEFACQKEHQFFLFAAGKVHGSGFRGFRRPQYKSGRLKGLLTIVYNHNAKRRLWEWIVDNFLVTAEAVISL